MAPLKGPIQFEPPERFPEGGRRAVGGSMVACIALVGGLYAMPNSPARSIRDQLFGDRRAGQALAATRSTESYAPLEPGLGKFEPRTGCYVGAFVIRDINISGRMERWEELTGKGHASYLRYVGYGKPFPKEWVAEVRRLGAVPNIALEPNAGLPFVMDDAYLRQFARDAAGSGGPVFLRFASEMNGPWTMYHGDPKKYRYKFRLVSGVMREEAPNVAMVWTPYCTPLRPIPDYYPGDDVVDWVGVNVYSVHHHDGDLDHPAHREDPTELLEPIYELYADRKPIQISEYAATHFCKACGEYTADFAMDKMIHMYRSLPDRFPRVKMIYWFSWDTVSGKSAENNYAVTDDPVIRDTYRRLVAPDYFLSRMPGAG
jgi:glycosyl hydrolase family 26